MIELRDIIIPSFYEAHRDIKQRNHTHYWFAGGRGSTKSSFVSLEIILNVINDPECNVICFRKIGKDIEASVYNQILWAIDILGVNSYFKTYKSPYRIVYTPTGQVIDFRGLDDATKTKSIKLKKGYYKISWFEELDEFSGIEEIRKAEQSVMRGGNQFIAFKSYNPPQNVNNWVNKEVIHERKDRLVTHNTYLDVPSDWLGEQFFIEAEFLKKFNELAYRHEYLGEVTGTGGLIFQNVQDMRITDDMIKGFDNLREGIDWGFAADPFAWNKMHYDKTRRCLYIYDEIHKVGLTNSRAMELLKPITQAHIIADSAEPKSVEDFRLDGFRITGARKGPDSVRYGIKWLQQLAYIYIDKERCPHTYEEFTLYELEKDKNGEFKDKYPDKNNHHIDEVRYALEDDMDNNYVTAIKGLRL
ncbi:MAG: PBSX family phage terminase large subunit [Muribaculaceae bacterium]|nr:PBSX family phage terminase large subunit [Muribaculaceae bacterium]